MKTTADFLDAMRVKLDLPSDGRLADYLGMHRQHISRYRKMGHSFDDEMSLRVADILEIDPAYVVACMHHQREKNDQLKKLWERIASLSIGVTAVLAVVALLPFVHLPNGDTAIVAMVGTVSNSGGLYIMSNLAANYWPFLALFVALILALPRHNPSPRSGRQSRK